MSPQVAGGAFQYTVQAKDSLVSLAARFGVDSRVISETNALKTSRLRPGQILKIDNRHIVPDGDGVQIVVNIPQRQLFYFKNGFLSQHFPIAAGKKGWFTPTGAFEIESLDEKPTWHVPPSIQEEMRAEGKPVLTVVAPGPKNPLGRYRLTTSIPGIAIHGTNAPGSIYSLKTHGCIRLHPDDIEKLFGAVDEGTEGRIIYEPVLLTYTGDTVFLEVHPDIYSKAPDPEHYVRAAAERNDLEGMIDWKLAKEVIRKHDGIARDITLRDSGRY
jgi:L,D-transpeptidase ErfK/SrfK